MTGLLRDTKESKFYQENRKKVLAEADGLCQVCFVEPCTEIDHRVPHYDGGSDRIDNLVAICSLCHKYKTRLEDRRRGRKRKVNAKPGI